MAVAVQSMRYRWETPRHPPGQVTGRSVTSPLGTIDASQQSRSVTASAEDHPGRVVENLAAVVVVADVSESDVLEGSAAEGAHELKERSGR